MAPKRKIPVCPLPCREEQFEDISVFIRDNVEHEMSRCMYVSGVPGTGKTLIVNAAVEELKTHNPDLDFCHIYVNGLTLGSNPDKLWKKMWKELSGKKLTPKQAHRKLTEHYETRGIVPTVLVVDELDQFLDRRQAILYQLLEWTLEPKAKFIFIAIFNTMNLPENALCNRNASRIGFTRVVFPPYDHQQLRTIVESSLTKFKRRKELNKDAVTLLSMKVAAISGDARRALEIAKRASEILEMSDKPGTKAVDEAFKELFTSPKVDTIRDCSTLEKCILEQIVSELTRTGSEEASFASIERSVIETSSYDGRNWSTDSITAALMRLVSMKLVMMETSGKFLSTLTRLSINVPTEDVKYALANQKAN